eukprot:CAMPEP_0202448906 /NCGR_PEP_ID=MMETSP1360-20130828/7698_1 /ASSEMBLY_ACC=CAM_ASM_000848 /TAXON_ID=515479 /ORGANISM="Licmophora paradoxa, Strain CCMP2313" /LENGTH=31 /DNA_ID= /DNA_START= /DNA_END= /DNA_ORIENTATION=
MGKRGHEESYQKSGLEGDHILATSFDLDISF